MGKFITIVAMIGVSVATFVMYTKPVYDKTKEAEEKVQRIEEALTKTRNIRRVRESLSSKFREVSEDDLVRLQKMIPDHVDNVRLVLDMDGIASQYGMRLKNVTVKDGKNTISAEDGNIIGSGNSSAELFESLIIQFDVTATYDEFMRFLEDLESSLRIVDLVALSMRNSTSEISRVQSPNTNINDEIYDFTLSLRTYWLKQTE